jgi:hypothetical protein
MCANAEKTIGNVMEAIEPDVVELLTIEGISGTPNGVAAIDAYNAAEQAALNWVPGTTAETVTEAINAFTDIFNTLPFPATAKGIVDAISAGIAMVVSIIAGNSPPPVAGASLEAHVEAVSVAAEAQVTKLTGYKPSFWDKARAFAGDTTVVSSRYKEQVRKAAKAAGAKYAALAA